MADVGGIVLKKLLGLERDEFVVSGKEADGGVIIVEGSGLTRGSKDQVWIQHGDSINLKCGFDQLNIILKVGTNLMGKLWACVNSDINSDPNRYS